MIEARFAVSMSGLELRSCDRGVVLTLVLTMEISSLGYRVGAEHRRLALRLVRAGLLSLSD